VALEVVSPALQYLATLETSDQQTVMNAVDVPLEIAFRFARLIATVLGAFEVFGSPKPAEILSGRTQKAGGLL
jgi:hypothetical protein